MPHNPRLLRAFAGAIALLAALAVVVGPSAAASTSSAGVPVIRLDGRGHGHGVGMSQWGAYTMARDGSSAADIIGAFYPGTQLTQRSGEVVVVVDRRDHVRVRFPDGGEVRSARSGAQHPGFPVRVAPGQHVDIVRTPEGYRVSGGSVAAAGHSGAVRYSASNPQDCILFLCAPEDGQSPAPTTTAPPDGDGDGADGGDEPGGGTGQGPEPAPAPGPGGAPGSTQPTPPPPDDSAAVSPTPVWAVPAGGTVQSIDRGRTYRGVLEVTGPRGQVKVRNHLDVEDYLKGMAEVPGNWPAAAVQAQAIAARTFAMRAMAGRGELCDSESCQVYVGTAHESPGQVAAVEATRGVVVTYGGDLAATFYSASGGGFAANVAEGFGSAHDVPYLPAHPYKTANPKEWSLEISLTDVAARLGYGGTIHAVRIDEVGPSGRPLRMTIEGDAGPVSVDPQQFRRRLGLRSTLFRIEAVDAEVAPPPPPPPNDPGVVGDVVTQDGATDAAPERRRRVGPLARSELAIRPMERASGVPAGPVALAALLILAVGLSIVHRLVGLPGLGILARFATAPAATMARWTRRP